jgi:hypothetical protein
MHRDPIHFEPDITAVALPQREASALVDQPAFRNATNGPGREWRLNSGN